MFPSRGLLLRGSSNSNSNAPSTGPAPGSTLDSHAIVILAVILCALISSLLINTLIWCANRCSNRTQLETEDVTADKYSCRMRRKGLRSLPLITYSAGLKLPGATGGECPICLSEFVVGDRIRVLPECNHGFHVPCVDQWLLARPSCPTCRRCLFSSRQEVSRCAEASRPGTAQSVILQLEPEGLLLGSLL